MRRLLLLSVLVLAACAGGEDPKKASQAPIVVIGIDSRAEDGDWFVYQYTGDPDKTSAAQRRTLDWVREVQERGAGEIVLNCMNQDGVRTGYDCAQLAAVRAVCDVPLIASGGAGSRLRCSPSSLATSRNWAWMSCHSRTRR